MNSETVLSIRRAGTSKWVDIDPRTAAGQRLLARFRISTTEEEMTATAAAVGANGADLRIVPGDNVGNMGAVLRARAAVGRTWAGVRGRIGAAFGWLRRTLHLDAVADLAKGVWGWVRDKVTIGAQFLGTSGMVGAGMVAISTHTGRKALGFALKPIGWGLGLIGRGYVALENLLHSDDRDGGVRNGISKTMGDVREYFFGTGTSASDGGLIGRAAVWAILNVGPYFKVGSLAMGLVNSIGMMLLAPRLFAAIALLPLGVFTLPAQLILAAWLALAVYVPFLFEIIGFLTSGLKGLKEEFYDDVTEADKVATKTSTVIETRVHEAAAQAAKAEEGKVVSHQAAQKVTQPSRRQQKAAARR